MATVRYGLYLRHAARMITSPSNQARATNQDKGITIMQTVITSYAGPTNTKGSRVNARCWLKNKAFGWDYSLNSEDNHKAAAQQLVDLLNSDRKNKETDYDFTSELSWSIIAVGSMPDGKGNAYIIDLIEA